MKQFTIPEGMRDLIPEECRIRTKLRNDIEARLDRWGYEEVITPTVEFYKTYEAGFDNINMDIIVGLPDETKEDVMHTLEEIKALGPDNLTVHSLAIKRAARLNTQKEDYAGRKSLNSESTMELTQDMAEKMGMKPYYLYRQKNMTGNMENVGYAKPGKEGIYNILIMEEMQTIVALGAGAITKAVYPNGRIERCENVKDIKTYLEKTDEMIERKKRLFADEKRSD